MTVAGKKSVYTDWDNVPLLMAPEHAAVLLMLTDDHVRRMCRTGKLPAVKIGAEWRISREAVRRMIEEGMG